jgi:hypothetical protein
MEITIKLLKNHINFKDEEFMSIMSKSNNTNIEIESDKKLRLLTYITLMCEYGLNDFKHLLVNRNLKESFIDYFVYITHNVGEFMKNEGTVVATIKLLTYTYRVKLNEQSSEQRTEMINKMISIALESYRHSNYIYVYNLLVAFKAFFDAINSSVDYIWYLQNMYLRSFEFYEIYNNLITQGDVVPKWFEEALAQIVEFSRCYFKKDEDNDIKVSSIRKMVNLIMAIILNEKISQNYEKLKQFWYLLHMVVKKDFNNVISGK